VEAKGNSKDKVQEYDAKLRKNFSQINFNIKGSVLPSNSNKVRVTLSYGCAKRDGVVLGGRIIVYDGNENYMKEEERRLKARKQAEKQAKKIKEYFYKQIGLITWKEGEEAFIYFLKGKRMIWRRTQNGYKQKQLSGVFLYFICN
jgi:hypothetical protein